MAKNLSQATRIGTNPDFLNGDIVDGAGGTLVNTHVNQDLVQFFQKLMALAGLSPNGNFDNEVNGYQLIDALLSVVNAGTKPKIIEIGDWNMDANNTFAKVHGLDFSKIRNVKVMIRNDANDSLYPMDFSISPADYNIYYARTLDIFLGRSDGGFFDNASFSSTSYNRGWIFIDYVP
jgi:hypothetical protein